LALSGPQELPVRATFDDKRLINFELLPIRNSHTENQRKIDHSVYVGSRQIKGPSMYLIAGFGVLMIFFCFLMAVNPQRFSEGIVTFSEKKWFHLFEIISRFIAGAIFIAYSNLTLYPSIFEIFGYGLVLVAIGLVALGPRRHKKFAVWAAHSFRSKFRLIGIASIPFGVLIIYMALAGQYA
jgi:uncharacterized protein YjeT (DUF2065 family)